MDGSDDRDLVTACIWAAALSLVVVVDAGGPLRALLGLPVLFVPGHLLTRALGIFSGWSLGHAALSVVASLAVVIGGGFLLDAVGMLEPGGWAVWLFAFVGGASLVAARRSRGLGLPRLALPAALTRRHMAAVAVAAAMTTGAYALAVRDESAQQQFKYTEFWLLPSPGNGALALGVRSREDRRLRFDIEVSLDGSPFAVFRSVALAPGETWTRELPVPQRAKPQKAEARLYRIDGLRLYRSVSALVPGGSNATE